MSKNQNMKVTSIASLSAVNMGELVELPGWTKDTPFVVRLRRASLSGMIRAGKIPNPLMAAAQRLYEGPKSRASCSFKEIIEVQRLVVCQAMMEPSLATLEENNLELTEDQINHIYTYAIRGPKELERFRDVAANNHADSTGDAE